MCSATLLAVYQELISVGMIYGTLMWRTLLEQMYRLEGTILYLHSGGLISNETMLARYRYSCLYGN